MIIGVCGLASSGKSEVAKHLEEKHGTVSIAFADPLKRILMETFDFTEEQLWGPSEKRSEPDKRYPRPEHRFRGPSTCEVCGFKLGKGVPEPLCYLTPRYALQSLGTEWGRNCYPNVWVDHTLRTVEKILKKDGNIRLYNRVNGLWVHEVPRGMPEEHVENIKSQVPKGVVISDVRYRNEFDAVKNAGGKVIWLRREGVSTPKWDHTSETEMMDIPDNAFDYYLVNDQDKHHLGMMVDRMMDVFNGRLIPYDDAQKDVPPFKR
jgi:hypothetical protein